MPVLTAALNLIDPVHHLGADRIAILSPYPDRIEAIQHRFFAGSGVDVTHVHSLGLESHELDVPDAEQIYVDAFETWRPEAELLCISCLNYRAQGAVQPLESKIGAPVVTSLTAPPGGARKSKSADLSRTPGILTRCDRTKPRP